jgi:hypothetical protein
MGLLEDINESAKRIAGVENSTEILSPPAGQPIGMAVPDKRQQLAVKFYELAGELAHIPDDTSWRESTYEFVANGFRFKLKIECCPEWYNSAKRKQAAAECDRQQRAREKKAERGYRAYRERIRKQKMEELGRRGVIGGVLNDGGESQ